MTLPLLRSGLKGGLRLTAAGLSSLVHRAVDEPRILTYHGVCQEPVDEWSVTPAQLRAQMRYLAENYQPVSLDRLMDWWEGGQPLPSRAVCVTFDDGYLDVLTEAAPILQEEGVPGAVFVAPALVSRGAAAAHPGYHPSRPFLQWGQLLTLLEAGWTVGSHTSSHPALSRLSPVEARAELYTSKSFLEQRLGRTVEYLAYPYGTPATVSSRDIELARQAGYRAAFLSVTGALTPGSDALALPRSKVLASDGAYNFRSLLQGRLDVWGRLESAH